ncbi:hypothetical protein AA0120_g12459 [Alternaria tenuissima]|nr:hypothetical protein AA0120_g12459 [Alternaria tenuissima]
MSSDSPAGDATNNTTTEAPQTPRKKPSKLGGQSKNNEIEKAPAPQASQTSDDDGGDTELEATIAKPRKGRRMVPVHQSRIADRPVKEGEKDSSLKIKIELDLEVEVELYARVKGDVTIGLM